VRCASTAGVAEGLRDPDAGNSTLNHPAVVPPTIDSATTAAMILLCGHPAAAGCESAQSKPRSSLRRPGAPAGCSRCERSLDAASGCAASSRVVPLICVPLPPGPRSWARSGSDASTVYETPGHSAGCPRQARLVWDRFCRHKQGGALAVYRAIQPAPPEIFPLTQR